MVRKPLYVVSRQLYVVRKPLYVVRSPLYVVRSPLYVVRRPLCGQESAVCHQEATVCVGRRPQNCANSNWHKTPYNVNHSLAIKYLQNKNILYSVLLVYINKNKRQVMLVTTNCTVLGASAH